LTLERHPEIGTSPWAPHCRPSSRATGRSKSRTLDQTGGQRSARWTRSSLSRFQRAILRPGLRESSVQIQPVEWRAADPVARPSRTRGKPPGRESASSTPLDRSTANGRSSTRSYLWPRRAASSCSCPWPAGVWRDSDGRDASGWAPGACGPGKDVPDRRLAIGRRPVGGWRLKRCFESYQCLLDLATRGRALPGKEEWSWTRPKPKRFVN
jgi:hypothetical protein